MRILVLDTNVAYANPTPRVLLSALAKIADVTFGGIGYDADTSDLKALERRVGRFDVILGQTWMYGTSGVGQFGDFVPRDLNDHPAPKVLNLLQVDPYAIPEYIYQNCICRANAVITTVASPQFPCLEPDLSSEREAWFDRNLFMIRNPHLVDERWLMLPHCISQREFVAPDRVRKRWDIIVPGAGYYFRNAAKAYLSEQPDITMASLEGLLQRFLYWATSYYRAQQYADLTSWFHDRFRMRIAACRVGVTCDGSVGYAIRKFFEIPAFGTLLAARFFPNADTLGFRDGENCFAIEDDTLGQLNDITSFARSDSAQAFRMQKAGQEMVREYHTDDVRAQQLVELLGRVCSGNNGGLRWEQGKPVFLAPNSRAPA